MSKKKLILLHVFVFLILGIYIFLSLKFRIYCPIKKLTGIPCPACGSTRAVLALLRGDFKAYLSFNPFAVPLLFVVLGFCHIGLFKRRSLAVVLMLSVCISAFIYNILKIV